MLTDGLANTGHRLSWQLVEDRVAQVLPVIQLDVERPLEDRRLVPADRVLRVERVLAQLRRVDPRVLGMRQRMADARLVLRGVARHGGTVADAAVAARGPPTRREPTSSVAWHGSSERRASPAP